VFEFSVCCWFVSVSMLIPVEKYVSELKVEVVSSVITNWNTKFHCIVTTELYDHDQR
jgi:hypothetical protein